MTNRTTPTWSVAALLLALTLGVGACGESLTEVNENPNEPTSVPGEAILPNATVSLVNNMYGSFWSMSLWQTWSQQLAKIQYPDEDIYSLRADALQPFWDSFYNIGRDWEEIIRAAQATGDANGEAIGRIMKSFTFHLIVDAWGPAPYTEAFQLEEGNSTPAYDTDRSIYESLLSSLATAQGMIDPSGSFGGQNDLLYGGNMAQWRKFANSVRLMLAMRMSSVDPGFATPIVQAAVSAGTFESNADNAVLNYLSSSPNRHPVYVNRLSRDDHRTSETMLSVMRNWEDPRISIYADPAVDSEPGDPLSVRYNGAVNGKIQPQGFSAIVSFPSYWADNPSNPAPLMTYAQVLFYKAEAAHRGMIGGSAQDYYEQGIQAAMDMYGIAQSEIDAYMAQDGVAWGTGGMEPMQQIGIQKWLANFMGDAVDTYAEIRRLGYPAIVPGPDAHTVNAGHPPLRILYPPFEQTLNGSSYQEAASMLGADDLGHKIFWDPDPMVP